MDKHTFGSSKAAVNLTDMLGRDEYHEYQDRATRILSRWFEYSSAILDIQNPSICRGTLNIWRGHFREWVGNGQFPEIIRRHIDNVMTAQYRRAKKRIDDRE